MAEPHRSPAAEVTVVLAPTEDGVDLVDVLADGTGGARRAVTGEALAEAVARRESAGPVRWVWADTASIYPRLLADGVRVARCHDLRSGQAILRWPDRADAAPHVADRWEAPATAGTPSDATLFEWDGEGARRPSGADVLIAEFSRQRAVVSSSSSPGALRLLLAAESASALVAAEMSAAGIPWDATEHDRILVDVLGSRGPGGIPARISQSAAAVRDALGQPDAQLDSPPQLLRALHRAGVFTRSTSKWELREHRHPVVEPLLEYKRLTRLLSANGWTWLDTWVRGGRFRPVYIPGGVVTGRWASAGGGALQIPRLLREAVRADDGWLIVSADVAQLEPRVLAAMSGDLALARAARGRDLYEGIVRSTPLRTRAEAKIAMLGAMYGATTGASGRLVPHLRRSFPRAMALVDGAATRGERGEAVSTLLGRTTPPASLPSASDHGAPGERAAAQARERGRFTRNFIVQGTAAEWAAAWLADLRGRLHALPLATVEATASGPVFSRRAHLAYFLHDEVLIHAPAEHAEAAAEAVRAAADTAGRLLFGDFPLDFPVEVRIGASAGGA